MTKTDIRAETLLTLADNVYQARQRLNDKRTELERVTDECNSAKEAYYEAVDQLVKVADGSAPQADDSSHS